MRKNAEIGKVHKRKEICLHSLNGVYCVAVGKKKKEFQ